MTTDEQRSVVVKDESILLWCFYVMQNDKKSEMKHIKREVISVAWRKGKAVQLSLALRCVFHHRGSGEDP